MVFNSLVVADYGPRFLGWVGRARHGLVCVAASRYRQDATVRAVMRELVKREGGDCDTCGNCPIGRMHE